MARAGWLAVTVAAAASLAAGEYTYPMPPDVACAADCCCKACSDTNHDSYPYGQLSVQFKDAPKETGGPVNPVLLGSNVQCQVPTWADVAPVYYDDDDNKTTPDVQYSPVPNTIWWRDFTFFGDLVDHVAPTSCSCCRWSGLHTNCQYEAPSATKPANYLVIGENFEANDVTIEFYGGIEQSINDIAELRDTTLCGYDDPPPAMQNSSMVSTDGDNLNSTRMQWGNLVLPSAGCYKVCYFHASMTTPTWYDMGSLDVLPVPTVPAGFEISEDQVVLELLEVTLNISQGSGYSIFEDGIELRHAGTACGSGIASEIIVESAVADTSRRLNPAEGYTWCNPAVEAQVTVDRPRRYLAIGYLDCPLINRVKVPAVTWTITLPSAGSYGVCYRREGVWASLGDLVVPAKEPVVDALMALYDASGGENWYHSHGWGTATDPCLWYGIKCNDAGEVVTISLARNNLVGHMPENFTRGAFEATTVLCLERNQLYGPIPQSIGHWSSLAYLDLGYNQITGEMPLSIKNCPIRSFYAADNDLEGELPYGLRSLT
eukprot:gene11950-18437_t